MKRSTKRQLKIDLLECLDQRTMPATAVGAQLNAITAQTREHAPAAAIASHHQQTGALAIGQLQTQTQAQTAGQISAAAYRYYPDPFKNTGTILPADLKKGDIIVSTTTGWLSAGIRKGTFSLFSHAAVYIGDGKIIEAVSGGVKKHDLSVLTKPATVAGVIRVNDLSDTQADTVAKSAQQKIGKWYNGLGLYLGYTKSIWPNYRLYQAITGQPLKVSGSTLGWGYFCSEVVIKSYSTAGVRIAEDGGSPPAGIVNYAMDHPTKFTFVGTLPIGK